MRMPAPPFNSLCVADLSHAAKNRRSASLCPLLARIWWGNLRLLSNKTVHEMKKLLLALPVVAAAWALAQSGARAFTFENGSPSTGTGAAITDPDEQVKKFGSGNGSSQQGGLSFSIGPANGYGLNSRSNSPPSWVGNPLYLDKGSSQRDQ